MCGINGIITEQITAENDMKTILAKMNNLIIHRGPDEDGFFTEANDSFSLGMAMRRLSIIDLASGKQPIFSDDKQIVIVFNGEIYNYRELKSELIEKGATFKTTSDTEVILKLYELEGTASFKKLDGMFAFSIYDKNTNKLYIARDFFGEKPLYYSIINDGLYFSSDIRVIQCLAEKQFKKKFSEIYR